MTDCAVDPMVLVPDDPNVVCTITKIGPALTKVKSVNEFNTAHDYEVSVSAITYPSAGATTPDPGPYSAKFIATISKSKGQTKLLLVTNDLTNSINAVPVIPGVPPTNYPVSFKVKIQSPGQNKVRSN